MPEVSHICLWVVSPHLKLTTPYRPRYDSQPIGPVYAPTLPCDYELPPRLL